MLTLDEKNSLIKKLQDKVYQLEKAKAIKRQRQTYYKTNRENVLKKVKEYSHTFYARFAKTKRNAKMAGKVFTLTREQYERLVKDNRCHYCFGSLPISSGGLDRKDSAAGYTLENVVPCCWTCNDMKGQYITYQEMVLIWTNRRSVSF